MLIAPPVYARTHARIPRMNKCNIYSSQHKYALLSIIALFHTAESVPHMTGSNNPGRAETLPLGSFAMKVPPDRQRPLSWAFGKLTLPVIFVLVSYVFIYYTVTQIVISPWLETSVKVRHD